MRFSDKASARDSVWTLLEQGGLGAYPFPLRGRIPNFRGAREAALRLFDEPAMAGVQRIKANPDSPQRFVRAEALRRGIAVYVPTPRLAGGFMLLDPTRIPADAVWQASARSKWDHYAVPVALEALPPVDLIVTGSVAVTPAGKRSGKGAGYSDLEFAILRELRHPPVPVATTVHDVQVVDDFPIEPHDQPLALIVTPTRSIRVAKPLLPPTGVDWARLPADAIAAMPVLASLRALAGRAGGSAGSG
jgi:5-formyltetrahydrofolate cyclo-ligase